MCVDHEGWGGVGMCRGLTITLFVSFFDKNYAATIPKSRIEFVRFFFNFLTL